MSRSMISVAAGAPCPSSLQASRSGRIAATGRVPDDRHVTAADHASPLTLHPDRLFPADPACAAIARELYEAIARSPADLPARARRSAPALLRRAVRRPGQPARHLGPLRDEAAPRRPASRSTSSESATSALSEERRAKHLAAALRELGRLPRHRGALLARVLSSSTCSASPSARRCRRPMRSTTRSSRASARTRSGRGRSTPASASRCSRRLTTRATTSAPTGCSPTTRPGRGG